jgi:hypothetical protein
MTSRRAILVEGKSLLPIHFVSVDHTHSMPMRISDRIRCERQRNQDMLSRSCGDLPSLGTCR